MYPTNIPIGMPTARRYTMNTLSDDGDDIDFIVFFSFFRFFPMFYSGPGAFDLLNRLSKPLHSGRLERSCRRQAFPDREFDSGA
mmetsp:Transcript_9693/g.21913  ORF Transcript_9693/g.21913 Transcript_9693/m.21913 type:complete len:84 (-) Transcript_9693:537-788(-)